MPKNKLHGKYGLYEQKEQYKHGLIIFVMTSKHPVYQSPCKRNIELIHR